MVFRALLLVLCLSLSLHLSSLVVVHCGACLDDKAFVLLRFHLSASQQRASHSQLFIEPEAMRRVEEMEGRLAVLSIIGQYRSGKSTLLNQLLTRLKVFSSSFSSHSSHDVFSVGHTVEPHTENVALYALPPCHLSLLAAHDAMFARFVQENVTIVLMDTPGLFAPNRADLFDAQLLAVINLVSSVVLYNTMGVIQRAQVEQLSEAVEAAYALSYYGDEGGQGIDRPHLLWTIQNLQVDLKDREGRPMTGKAYIQNLLSEIDAVGSLNNSAKISQRFNRFFRSIDSFPLPFPTEKYKDAQHINELDDSAFSQEYKDGLTGLYSRSFGLVEPKHLGSSVLNGAALATLLTSWVENVNVPTERRQNSASVLMTHIVQKEVQKAVEKYKQLMRDGISLPQPDSKLRAAHDEMVARTLESARTGRNDLPDFLPRFQSLVDVLYTEYVKLNEGQVKTLLEEKMTTFNSEWSTKATELQAAQPIDVATFERAKGEALRVWRSSIEPIQQAASSLLPEFERSVIKVIEDLRAPMLTEALGKVQVTHLNLCLKKLTELLLPKSAQDILKESDQCLSEWHATRDLYPQADSEAVQKMNEAFESNVAAATEECQARNEASSLKHCLEEAKKLGDVIVSDSRNWLYDERYQSLTLLNTLIDEALTKDICSGPATNSTPVLNQVNVARQRVTEEMEQRMQFARIFDVFAVLLAGYDIYMMRKLMFAPTPNKRDKKDLQLLLNGGSNTGYSELGPSSMDGVCGLLSAPSAVAVLVIARLVPDAAPYPFIYMVSLLSAILSVSFGVYIWGMGSSFRANRKSYHEH